MGMARRPATQADLRLHQVVQVVVVYRRAKRVAEVLGEAKRPAHQEGPAARTLVAYLDEQARLFASAAKWLWEEPRWAALRPGQAESELAPRCPAAVDRLAALGRWLARRARRQRSSRTQARMAAAAGS